MSSNKIKLKYFILFVCIINLILYHLPIYRFTLENLNYKGIDRNFMISSLAILIISVNALVIYISLFFSRFISKLLMVLFANLNAIAIYFINTYNVIIDKSMIGNILNTNIDESTSFFSFNLVLYIFFLGIE